MPTYLISNLFWKTWRKTRIMSTPVLFAHQFVPPLSTIKYYTTALIIIDSMKLIDQLQSSWREMANMCGFNSQEPLSRVQCQVKMQKHQKIESLFFQSHLTVQKMKILDYELFIALILLNVKCDFDGYPGLYWWVLNLLKCNYRRTTKYSMVMSARLRTWLLISSTALPPIWREQSISPFLWIPLIIKRHRHSRWMATMSPFQPILAKTTSAEG